MSARVQVAVSGAGVADGELTALAEEVGRLLAEAGATVVCGGLGGVMEAAARGARSAGGDVIGVLPFEDASMASEHVTHAVATGIGHARNLAVVASASSVIAIGGEWGTLTEIGFARRLLRPVVLLESWSLTGRGDMAEAPGIERAASPVEAVEMAMRHADG